MRPDNTLLLVGHKTEPVRRAKALGLDVILFQHKDKLEPEQARLADVTFVVDYRNWGVVRPVVEAAHRTWGIRAALSLTEPGLDIAARINDLFGLGGTGYEVSHRLRDKYQMRRHLAATGADTIGAGLVDDRASLVAFGREYGYPFIVKPTDMTAGWGVLPVATAADTPRVWAEIQRLRREGVSYGTTLFTIQEFLMEEYVSGPEFSVEAFSFDGRHAVVAVTEKLVSPDRFVELGHALPARLDIELERAIVDATRRFLDDIGLKNGPSHTEVKVGARGPVVIESHNRIGGDRIGDLVRAAYGIDLVEYALGWPFRLVEELPDRPQPLAGACVRFLHGHSGQVVALGGLEEVEARPEVLAAELSVEVGDVLRPLQNNWDRLGLVAVRERDCDAAVALCHELVGALRIETTEAPVAGVQGR
jgi:ATP-grasp domain-containing protein/L-aminoacid ligase-like protein